MQQLASSSLFDYSRETSSADVYTGTAYYIKSQSVRYIDILYISVFKIKVTTSIYLSFFSLNFTPRAKINICSIQFVQNVFFEDILYIRCIKIMKIYL